MVKFHISQATGQPERCRAEVRACPVGGEHFDNFAVAQAKITERLAEEHEGILEGQKRSSSTNNELKLEQVINEKLAHAREERALRESRMQKYKFDDYSNSEIHEVIKSVKAYISKETYNETPELIEALAKSKHKGVLKQQLNGIVMKTLNMADESRMTELKHNINDVLKRNNLSLDRNDKSKELKLLDTGEGRAKHVREKQQAPVRKTNLRSTETKKTLAKVTQGKTDSILTSNVIKDYVPLNEDTALNRKYIEELKKYEEPKGFFGNKSRKSKVIEDLVHNQIILKCDGESLTFEKISAESYSANVNQQIEIAKREYDKHVDSYSGSRSSIEKSLNEYIESYETNVQREKKIHDLFVEDSKNRLIARLSELGYDDNPIVSKIARVTKASELKSFDAKVNTLKKKDPFEELMAQKAIN